MQQLHVQQIYVLKKAPLDRRQREILIDVPFRFVDRIANLPKPELVKVLIKIIQLTSSHLQE